MPSSATSWVHPISSYKCQTYHVLPWLWTQVVFLAVVQPYFIIHFIYERKSRSIVSFHVDMGIPEYRSPSPLILGQYWGFLMHCICLAPLTFLLIFRNLQCHTLVILAGMFSLQFPPSVIIIILGKSAAYLGSTNGQKLLPWLHWALDILGYLESLIPQTDILQTHSQSIYLFTYLLCPWNLLRIFSPYATQWLVS